MKHTVLEVGALGQYFTLIHMHHIISVEKTNLKTSNIGNIPIIYGYFQHG